ncbi:MAG: hypothetical protein SA339_01535 [Methanomassiliicoccus sp.]|nr:hypothetical protein [Methanomassiliicoccus sp.]
MVKMADMLSASSARYTDLSLSATAHNSPRAAEQTIERMPTVHFSLYLISGS